MILSVSGSEPSATGNSRNWPGLIAVSGEFAVHVTLLTISLTSPSSALIGVASLVVWADTDQPAIGVVATEGTGLSVGNATSSFVVDAVSLSVGTRKAIRASPPACAGPPSIVTWALAAGAKPPTATA